MSRTLTFVSLIALGAALVGGAVAQTTATDMTAKHRGHGFAAMDTNKDGALDNFRKSLAVFEALVKRDPTNADWKRSEAVMRNKVGDVLLARHETADALAQYEAAFAIVDALRAKDLTNTDWQADTAVGYEKVGDALAARGDRSAGCPPTGDASRAP